MIVENDIMFIIWMGHVALMPDERPMKTLLHGVLEEGSLGEFSTDFLNKRTP